MAKGKQLLDLLGHEGVRRLALKQAAHALTQSAAILKRALAAGVTEALIQAEIDKHAKQVAAKIGDQYGDEVAAIVLSAFREQLASEIGLQARPAGPTRH